MADTDAGVPQIDQHPVIGVDWWPGLNLHRKDLDRVTHSLGAFRAQVAMTASLLRSNRSQILSRWQQALRETYERDTATFLGRVGNQFANPVGELIRVHPPALLDALIEDALTDEVIQRDLLPLIRVRAVQDFSPSEAIRFVFSLKEIVREKTNEPSEVYRRFYERVDRLVLAAFDCYAKCKEHIYQIQLNQIKNRTFVTRHRAEKHKDTIPNGNATSRPKGGNGR